MTKLACLVLVVALFGCESKSVVSSPGGDTKTSPTVGVPGKIVVTGVVKEVLNSDGKSYIRLQSGKQERWVAVPQAQVKAGETITLRDCKELPTFTSKELNRTFERILEGTLGAPEPGSDKGGAPASGPAPAPASGPAPAKAAPASGPAPAAPPAGAAPAKAPEAAAKAPAAPAKAPAPAPAKPAK